MTQSNQNEFYAVPRKSAQTCLSITSEQLERARREFAERETRGPRANIDETAIILALDNTQPYFITSNLYWECNCENNCIRPAQVPFCEECGLHREDAPDARIGDMKAMGIHVDWSDPEAMRSLEEHNLQWRWPPDAQK